MGSAHVSMQRQGESLTPCLVPDRDEVRKSGLSLEGWIVGGAERDDGEVSLREPPSQIVLTSHWLGTS